jgi:flagellar hook-length control protein FliK
MQSSAISQSGHVLSLYASGREPLPLRAGEIVTADVLSVGSDNAATIRLKNTVLEVQTDVALKKGDTLTLRVEKQENTVYLRLAGNAFEQPDSVKSALVSALSGFEKLKPAAEGMARLVNLLSRLPEPLKENLPEVDIISRFLLQIEHLSANAMKDMVQNGGVFFETKLRVLALGLEAEGGAVDIEAGRIIAGDLKASLLRLKDTFLAPAVLEQVRSRISPDELLGALNTVLRNIEFYQLQSKLSDSLQFFLPLVWRQLKDGEIIVRQYDHGKPGERSYACTVNLDLERAGKVRVNLAYQAGYVHVTCAAENSAFSRLFQDGSDLLAGQFSASGLRLGHLAVHHEPQIDFRRNHAPEGLSIRV